MSWLPRRMAAVPSAGQRDTMVAPVGSWYWITSMIAVSCGSGLASRALAGCDRGADHLPALPPLAVARAHGLLQPVESRSGIVAAGCRQGGDVALELRQVVHHREVELVQPFELAVADLHRIEQAGGPVVAEADGLRQTVELPVEAVETVQGADLARVGESPRAVAQQRLQPSQLGGQVLAQRAVHVAPQLAVLEPPITGDLLPQPFEKVAVGPCLLVGVAHAILLRRSILSGKRFKILYFSLF